jgi:lipopolysaccharide export system protein LptC
LTTVSYIDASYIDEHGTRAVRATGRSDGERMYRRAMRHSRNVRVLRLALPITIVLAGLATIVVATWLDPLRKLAKLPVDAAGLVVSGTKITMQQPRMAGFTRDARPYVVTASTATQDLLNPDTLELHDIHSVMELVDKTKFDLTAKDGIYDTKNEKMALQTNIVVISTRYTAYLSQAQVDVKLGHVVSERPVEVKMLQGTINGNRMEVLNSGDVIRFERGVTVVLDASVTQERP